MSRPMNERTVYALENFAGTEFSSDVLESAQGNAIHSDYDSDSTFYDRSISNEPLETRTVGLIAEQLYRQIESLDVLGAIVNGVFGTIMIRGMIKSALSQKRGKTASKDGKQVRTQWGKNMAIQMYSEFETMKETALALLFGAVEKQKILFPCGEFVACDIKTQNDRRLRIRENRILGSYTAYEIMTNSETEIAVHASELEISMLNRIVAHNGKNLNNRGALKFMMSTLKRNYKIDTCFGFPIPVQFRIASSMTSGTTSCVQSAFATAVHNFMVLERGHNDQHVKYETEDTLSRMSRYHHDFVPAIIIDDLKERVTSGLKRRILKVAEREHVENATHILSILRDEMINPPSRSVFFREFEELCEMARAYKIE